jgi:cell volume regulation protein A
VIAEIGVHLPVDGAVLAGGALLLLGVVGSASAGRLHLPAVLVVLGLGMLIGDDGLDLVSFSDVDLAQSVAVIALVAILFDGGLATTAPEVRRVALPAGLLATGGVVVTAGVVAVVADAVLDIPRSTAVLIGAVVSSTDAAAVFSVLRGAPVGRRVRSVLETESGFNDPIAVLLVVGVLEVVAADVSGPEWVVFGARQLGGGALIGLAAGWLGAELLRRVVLPTSSLAPVVGLATAAIAYGAATSLGCSGFLATYLAGVVASTMASRWRRPLRRFHEAAGVTAEIVLFLLLGLLVFPSRLDEVLVPALGITAVLVAVARPLAVALLLGPLRFRAGDLAVISWAGLRGAVPMVLATFPLTEGHADGELVFDVAFVVVLVATAVQGSTVGLVARRFTAADDEPAAALAEVVPVDVAGVDVVEVVLSPSSPAVDRPLQEVPLPPGVRIGVVGRDDGAVVPTGATALRAGDRVVVMAVGRPDLAALVDRWASPAG